ncbi:coronatine-insensitive protein 1-like [Rutidosis leptorrhynchoides]|uniref:coronatine-insensitive protein 1-like n=1 Tax=Rutidosis leptorrhynchoides TaxID=125765 RepID=UPI003A99199B
MDSLFDCVVPSIHEGSDRNSFSSVSRTCYDLDAKTRKHVTVHLCYATPFRCHQRFPFIKSLTLTGSPHINVDLTSSPCNWDHNVTPWVQEIATSFKGLKSVSFQRLVVHDSDLELLAKTRGAKLSVLEIDSCPGFSTDGLLFIGKYCNDLRILSLENSSINEINGEWLHELALHSTSIESLNFNNANLTKFDVKDLALVAKYCSHSLVSVKISDNYDFIDLVEFFKNAVNLEYFGGGRFGNKPNYNHNHYHNALVMNRVALQDKYKEFKFPPKLKSLALNPTGRTDILLPFAHLITQLVTTYLYYGEDHINSFFNNCPNLEALYMPVINDKVLIHLSKFCKNLRKLYMINKLGYSCTEDGLFALAQGCQKLECLHISLSSITDDTMSYVGTQMKNLSDLSMVLVNNGVKWKKNQVLDNGVRTLLMGCTKLERFSIQFQKLGGLSDGGLENIGKFGCNLRYLCLGYVGKSDAGLMELSYGCPKLQELVVKDCPFSMEAFDIFRCRVTSLRYFEFPGIPRHCRYLLEQDQQLFTQIV